MNDKAEEYTKIIMEDEYIMLYDDRITISWYRYDTSEVNFKMTPRLYKLDLIFKLLGIIIFSWFIWSVDIKNNKWIAIYVMLPFIIGYLVIGLYRLLFLSCATEIQKDKIKKISVSTKNLSIFYDTWGRKKKRIIKLPNNKIDKETALQLLKANKLID